MDNTFEVGRLSRGYSPSTTLTHHFVQLPPFSFTTPAVGRPCVSPFLPLFCRICLGRRCLHHNPVGLFSFFPLSSIRSPPNILLSFPPPIYLHPTNPTSWISMTNCLSQWQYKHISFLKKNRKKKRRLGMEYRMEVGKREKKDLSGYCMDNVVNVVPPSS